MLSNLHVKNLALIEECDINLHPGLNILSGETGAGKSILIGSINLALGAKADRDMIRHGAEYGLVELVFENLDDSVKKALDDMDIPSEEDVVILQRKLMPNKSILKINGETATVRQVRALAETLIDIHGQHEHQSLLKNAKHMEILDSFAGKPMEEALLQVKEAYHRYQSLKEQLENENLDENQRKRELDLVQYEVTEIEEAGLRPGEDEALERDYRLMSNSRHIREALAKCMQYTDQDQGAGAMVSMALREIKQVLSYAKELEDADSMLMDIDSLLSDFNRTVMRLNDSMEFSEEAFAQTEERLNQINRLKDKYGYSIEEILTYLEKQKERLETLLHYEEHIACLEREKEAAHQKLAAHCKTVTEYRKEASGRLAEVLTGALKDLNFLDVRFAVKLLPREHPNASGSEEVEFQISTNPGEPLKPMGQVASGGELSRIMLAIKTVLAKKDAIDTLIFDEIDSGISGRTAWKVSEKLGELSRAHQIICITHLPQIAAMADSHYLIDKSVQDGSTVSTIDILKEEASIKELARMVGGDALSDSAMEHARSIRAQAEAFKAGL